MNHGPYDMAVCGVQYTVKFSRINQPRKNSNNWVPLTFFVSLANFKSSLWQNPFIFSFQNLTVRYFSTVEDSPVEASPSPYLGIFKIPKTRASKRGYQIPKSGHIQLVMNKIFCSIYSNLDFQTLFNPEGSVVRIFSIPYNYSEMPPSSKTILRQRIMLASSKRLKYLIHLRYQISHIV